MTGTVAGGVRAPRRARAAAFVALTKPRIVELLLVTTVPSMILAEQGLPPVWLIAATVVGGAMAAGGANALNMYVDRDIDRLMHRTRNRPLVTGAVRPAEAVVFAAALTVGSFVWLWAFVNLLSAALATAAAAFYVFVYSLWLKRTSIRNIVIGGAAGAVPTLVGWTAVTGSLDWPPVVLFAVIFYWTPPHFWALAIRYRSDYQAADVPMLPAVAGLRATARRIVALHGRPGGVLAAARAGGPDGRPLPGWLRPSAAPDSWLWRSTCCAVRTRPGRYGCSAGPTPMSCSCSGRLRSTC